MPPTVCKAYTCTAIAATLSVMYNSRSSKLKMDVL